MKTKWCTYCKKEIQKKEMDEQTFILLTEVRFTDKTMKRVEGMFLHYDCAKEMFQNS